MNCKSIYQDDRLVDVSARMKECEMRMNDYDWNGQNDLYESEKIKFKKYKDLYMEGVLFDPLF